MRTSISYGRIRPLLWVVGFLQRWSWVEITDGQILVRMSWGFRAAIPIESVQHVGRWEGRAPLSIGVHGWRGRWLVNGSRRGLVTIDVAPPSRARVIGVPVRLRELTVSVDEPAALVAAVASRG